MFNPVPFYEFGKSKITPLLSDLISYYDGSSQYDLVGANDISQNIGVSFTSGIIGSAFNFSGNPKFLDIADSFTTRFGSTSPFSISIWVFPVTNTATSGGWLINKRFGNGASNSDEYQIYLSPSYVVTFNKFNVTSPLSNYIQANGPTLPLNQWSHLVIADNGSTNANSANIYFNGVLFNSIYSPNGTFTGMGISNATTRIGLPRFNTTRNFQFVGKLDEIGLWKNRQLSQSDVTKLYNGGSGRTYPF
tara:strand:- start:362 stop:1105 length:744 start_codon:yes stop_codon:yes gene_type:complete